MAQGLLFHPIAFPLGRMFGHRHMGSSRCAVESDGVEGEGGFRQEAGSQSPGSSPSRVQMLPNHVCQCPFLRSEPAVCNFLASSFPSLCPIQCQNKPDRFQGSWNWDEKSKQGLSLSTISIRDWGKEGGRKEESLTADVQSCVLKCL